TQKESLKEDSARHLQVISESAKQMGFLIDDLLMFSRTARAELSKSRIRLEELMKSAMNDLQRDVQGRDIQWQIADLPELEADPSLLRQVMLNLLSNALKYTRTRKRARIEIGSVPN